MKRMILTIVLAVLVFGSLPAQVAQTASIDAWGRNDYSQLNVPVPNSGFIAIAAGGHHSLALKEDGSVAAWGIDDGSSKDYGQVTDTPTGTGFIAIAAGGFHSLGLKDDGSVVAWGRNNYGQSMSPSPIAALSPSRGAVPTAWD